MQLALVLVVSGLLVVPAVTQAERTIWPGVVGAGGGDARGQVHGVLCTVGQPVIGVVSDTTHIHEIGFWYLPGWIITGVDEGTASPLAFVLSQNSPNPFNPVTTFRVAVPYAAHVTMALYDVAGRRVATLADREFGAGVHEVVLDASTLASGVYFCRMASGGFRETRKLVLLK